MMRSWLSTASPPPSPHPHEDLLPGRAARPKLPARMKILFLVERPTQFEAPFFRYVQAHHGRHTLRVLFTGPNAAVPVGSGCVS